MNIDYAMLMHYAAPLAQHYMHLEDDVSFSPAWATTVMGFLKAQPPLSAENSPWHTIDFSGIGCLGKTFQSIDLPRFAEFLNMFYDQLPCEALLIRWMRSMTQGKLVEFDPKGQNVALFKHEGDIDSYKGRKHVTKVVCGGHTANSCSQCTNPSKGEGWCHGDCSWIADTCVLLRAPSTPAPAITVVCGNHNAPNCAGCPQGNGEGWCHADCKWIEATQDCVPASV